MNLYFGGGRISRDNAAGPDTPVAVPVYNYDITGAEAYAIQQLPNSNPLRLAWEESMALNGTPVTNTDIQKLHTRAYDDPLPNPLKDFGGKGILQLLARGINYVNQTLMSRWSAVVNPYSKGTATLQFVRQLLEDGSIDPAQRAMYKIRTGEGGDKQGMSPIPLFAGLSMLGDRSSLSDAEAAIAQEHGIWLPEPDGGSSEKDDGFEIFNSIITGFNGAATKVGRFHNQLRSFNTKWVDSLYGLIVNKSSDSKLITSAFGRNVYKQFEFTDCASPQIICFDAWNPGNGDFKGVYGGAFYSCANYRMAFGEMNIVLNIEGDNSTAGNHSRYEHHNGLFLGTTLKASTDTYFGKQYVGGGGSITYDQIVRQRGASGVHWAFTCTTRGDFDPWDSRLPKYIWDVDMANGGIDSESGFITLTSPDLIDSDRTESTDKVVTAFRLHWAKRPELCVWRTNKPGQIILLPSNTAQVNLLKLTGSTQPLLKIKYPLCYLGMDDAHKLTDGNDATTFNAPAAITVNAGYSQFLVLW